MKLLKFTRQFAALAVVASLFTACDKVEKVDHIGDRGQTVVKIIDGGTPGMKTFAIDFVNTPTTIVGADIRRDVPNNAELNKSMTVTIQDDTAAVTAAGIAHLDPSWYTLGSGATKVGGEGGMYTVTFAPGEFAKPINIIIPDATVLDPSLTYGLGFRIVTTDGGIITANRTLVIVIGAKNKYDGIYQLKGRHNRPPYDFPYLIEEMHMVTTGASSVIFFWPDFGSVGHPIGIGPDPINDVSWYGAALAPEVVFDPATDLVTDVHNAGGPTAMSMYTGPGAPVSRYDPATRTIYLYFYYATSPTNNFSNRGWSDTLVYVGPR
jgi:hypothetical protein